jgi:hypothetical protein
MIADSAKIFTLFYAGILSFFLVPAEVIRVTQQYGQQILPIRRDFR